MILPIDIAQVEEYLSMWASLHMGQNDPRSGGARGFEGRTPGLQGSRGLASEDWGSIVYEAVDRNIARTVDAAVEDLDGFERAIIWHAYGLATVWRFPRGNYEELLARAKQHVGEGLVRRGVPV